MEEPKKLIDAILHILLNHESKQHQAWIDKMVERNNEARNEQLFTFLYGGVCYRHSRAPKGRHMNRGLHMKLTGEMAEFEKSKRALEKDRQFISQILFHIINQCDTTQDLRDALPECLVSIVPPFVGIPRTREAAWCLTNPDIKQQYLDWLPRIEMYVATRLIL